MNVDEINRLIDLANKEDKYTVCKSTGASVSSIDIIQRELNLDFCEPYVQFLKEFGQLLVVDNGICGIARDDTSIESSGTVIFESKEFDKRYGLPSGCTVLMNKEDEFYWLLNHKSQTISWYDPFARELGATSKTLESFIVEKIEVYLG